MSTPEWQEHEARRRYAPAPVSPPSGSMLDPDWVARVTGGGTAAEYDEPAVIGAGQETGEMLARIRAVAAESFGIADVLYRFSQIQDIFAAQPPALDPTMAERRAHHAKVNPDGEDREGYRPDDAPPALETDEPPTCMYCHRVDSETVGGIAQLLDGRWCCRFPCVDASMTPTIGTPGDVVDPSRSLPTAAAGSTSPAPPAARREGAEPDDHFVEPLTVELTARWLADGAEHYENGKGDALQAALFRRAERVVRALAARATGGVPSAVDLAVDPASGTRADSRSSPLSPDTATGSARSAPAPKGVAVEAALAHTPKGFRRIAADEVWLGEREIVVLGTPPDVEDEDDPDYHNCDAMGCSSVGWHVVARSSALAAPRSGDGETTDDAKDAARWRFFRRFLSVESDIAEGAEYLYFADDEMTSVFAPYASHTVDSLVDVAIDRATPLPGGPHGR